MRNIPLRNRWRAILTSAWHAVLFRKPKLLSWNTDQELLFEGSSCRLYWETKNVHMVKLYIGHWHIGNFLPKEFPIIPLQVGMELTIKACGGFRAAQETFRLAVQPLTYKNANRGNLKLPFVSPPSIINKITVNLEHQQPAQLTPIVKLTAISFETPYTRQLDTELYQEIVSQQNQLEAELHELVKLR